MQKIIQWLKDADKPHPDYPSDEKSVKEVKMYIIIRSLFAEIIF